MNPGFQVLMRETPEVAAAWFGVDRAIGERRLLDPKTAELAYLAVIAALGLERGVAFHAAEAKRLGACREEVLGAVLVGLPAAGHRVVESLAEALRAFDAG